jgi:hypothetical protein
MGIIFRIYTTSFYHRARARAREREREKAVKTIWEILRDGIKVILSLYYHANVAFQVPAIF